MQMHLGEFGEEEGMSSRTETSGVWRKEWEEGEGEEEEQRPVGCGTEEDCQVSGTWDCANASEVLMFMEGGVRGAGRPELRGGRILCWDLWRLGALTIWGCRQGLGAISMWEMENVWIPPPHENSTVTPEPSDVTLENPGQETRRRRGRRRQGRRSVEGS